MDPPGKPNPQMPKSLTQNGVIFHVIYAHAPGFLKLFLDFNTSYCAGAMDTVLYRLEINGKRKHPDLFATDAIFSRICNL